MGEDITIINALYNSLQRVECKLDDIIDDMSTIKIKQAQIDTSLKDHIENTEPKKSSGMDTAKAFILKYIIPIALAILMLGRMSVGWVGNGYGIDNTPKAPVKEKIVNDDTFIARNEKFDSLLKASLKKSIKIGGD